MLNNVQENLGVIKGPVRSDDILHAGEDHELVFQAEGGPLLDHTIESVAHDRDQHIQERNLHDESRHYE